MLAIAKSGALLGIQAIPVSVEVDVANGLPTFTTVGLPDSSVRESKDRVKAAIRNCGYEFPNRRITVNLAPADLRKEGPAFDLPIALGVLAAAGVLPAEALSRYLSIGELSLDGLLRPVAGVLSLALTAAEEPVDGVIVPFANGSEARLAGSVDVIAARSLAETVEILRGVREPVEPPLVDEAAPAAAPLRFEDIKGQQHLKRALEIGVAGMHNVLMRGVPGSGKTLLARSLPSIMPDWSGAERLETTRIYSVCARDKQTRLMTHRPFRAPHHTVSDAGLIGGGVMPRPGEVSLAHNGVLFLDELPEFRKHVLEVLRQPLEDGEVTISRAQTSVTYPARFMLVAAMNPCPCGYRGDRRNRCQCDDRQISRYAGRISGPLLDRIDMHLEAPAVDLDMLRNHTDGDSSATIRKRVNRARLIQADRFAGTPIHTNAQMHVKDIENFCHIEQESKTLLESSVDTFGLSARAYFRILKLARTIADLAGRSQITPEDIAEGVQYRRAEAGR